MSLNVVSEVDDTLAKLEQPEPEHRSTWYAATPTLSIDAVQFRLICVALAGVATRETGAVGDCVSVVLPPAAARKTAIAAPQVELTASDAPTDTDPTVASVRSSAMSLVFGSTGTHSSMVKPGPAVKLEAFAVDTRPSTRSPAALVVIGPTDGATFVPCAVAAASSEPDFATPEYSRIAKRSVALVSESVTVTVLEPPEMFSAKKIPSVVRSTVSLNCTA